MQDGQFQLSIEDNGPGFPAETSVGHGLALHGTLMAIMGGSLALETVVEGGTRVRLSLNIA